MSISTSTDALFNNAIFAALPNDSFRVKVSARNNGTLIWVECKQSKNQWQTTITNIGECGPSGFPEAAVFACLQVGRHFICSSSLHSDLQFHVKHQVALNVACNGGNFNEGPEVNASLSETNMKLTLKLTSIGTVWRPEFTFALLPVGLEKVDRLEAVLRDVQEENRAFRRTLDHNVDLIGETKPTTATWAPSLPKDGPSATAPLRRSKASKVPFATKLRLISRVACSSRAGP
jgi:hypothetical protein